MYIDPGSWSMVVQVLIGVVVAIPILMGVYWGKVKTFLSSRKSKPKDK